MKKELINQDICFGNTKTKEDYILWLKLAKIGVEINLIDKSKKNIHIGKVCELPFV